MGEDVGPVEEVSRFVFLATIAAAPLLACFAPFAIAPFPFGSDKSHVTEPVGICRPPSPALASPLRAPSVTSRAPPAAREPAGSPFVAKPLSPSPPSSNLCSSGYLPLRG